MTFFQRPKPGFSLPSTPLESAAALAQARENAGDGAVPFRLSRALETLQLKQQLLVDRSGSECLVAGRTARSFAGGPAIALGRHPEVLRAAHQALDESAWAEACSPWICHGSAEESLRLAVARYLGTEAACVAASTAELAAALIPQLYGSIGCRLYLDRNASQALRNGALLAQAGGAELVSVDVYDPPALEKLLKSSGSAALLLDSVHFAHGLSPDIGLLQQLCGALEISLLLDDSRGLAWRSSAPSLRASEPARARTLIFGNLLESIGTPGAFVAGPAMALGLLASSSPYGRECHSLPVALLESSLAAVRIAESGEGERLRAQLLESARFVRARLSALGFSVSGGESPLIAISLGDDARCILAARHLLDAGVYVPPLLAPLVPADRGVLRISLSSRHDSRDIEALLHAFQGLSGYLSGLRSPLRMLASAAIRLVQERFPAAEPQPGP